MKKMKTHMYIIAIMVIAGMACESALRADYYDDDGGGAGEVLAPTATGALLGGAFGGGRGAGYGAAAGFGFGMLNRSARKRSSRKRRRQEERARQEAYEQGRRDQQRQEESQDLQERAPKRQRHNGRNGYYQPNYPYYGQQQQSQFPEGGYQRPAPVYE